MDLFLQALMIATLCQKRLTTMRTTPTTTTRRSSPSCWTMRWAGRARPKLPKNLRGGDVYLSRASPSSTIRNSRGKPPSVWRRWRFPAKTGTQTNKIKLNFFHKLFYPQVLKSVVGLVRVRLRVRIRGDRWAVWVVSPRLLEIQVEERQQSQADRCDRKRFDSHYEGEQDRKWILRPRKLLPVFSRRLVQILKKEIVIQQHINDRMKTLVSAAVGDPLCCLINSPISSCPVSNLLIMHAKFPLSRLPKLLFRFHSQRIRSKLSFKPIKWILKIC